MYCTVWECVERNGYVICLELYTHNYAIHLKLSGKLKNDYKIDMRWSEEHVWISSQSTYMYAVYIWSPSPYISHRETDNSFLSFFFFKEYPMGVKKKSNIKESLLWILEKDWRDSFFFFQLVPQEHQKLSSHSLFRSASMVNGNITLWPITHILCVRVSCTYNASGTICVYSVVGRRTQRLLSSVTWKK